MIQVLQSKGLVRENFYLPTVFEYVENWSFKSQTIAK